VQSTFRNGLYAGIVVAAALGLWLAQLWQEENQVRLHSEHLLRKIEARNWAGAGDFMAGDYRDDWGDDRARLLDRLRLVLRSFSSLTITATNPQVRLDPPTGNWSAKIQIGGTGGEFAPEIIARVNSLTKPFELHWRRESWKPWDWKLIGVSNPSLEISGEIF
jgi:hypothetical protein